MKRGWLLAAGVIALAGGLGRPYAAAPQTAPASASARPGAPAEQALVNRYCVTCHNSRMKAGGLALDAISLAEVGTGAATWEKVALKLRAGAMPPPGRPRPDASAQRAFVSWLENELDRAARAKPNAGRTAAFHRLNRTEYRNAIRDLLALDLDVAPWLPGDDAAYGFDNIGDVLSVSPSLLDGYLSAATRISRLAVGDLTASAEPTVYPFSKLLLQEEPIGEDLPLGARGGVSVRHYFPLDGEYVVKVRFDGFPGPSEQVHLRVDGSYAGELNTSGRGSGVDLAEAGAAELRVKATAGSRVVGVVFQKRMLAAEGRFPAYFPWGNSGVFATTIGAKQYLRVNDIEVAGPFLPTGAGDTPSRQRVFICRPSAVADEDPCARRILSSLARRAYRRPVTDEDVATLLTFYRKVRDERGSFDAGIRAGIERLLVDPDFLYRVEREPENVPEGAPYRLTDLELASRLSFFLWSSIPDEELIRAAERGDLRNAADFERQVKRMLADERSQALVTSFGAQWLHLRNVRMVSPDLYQFPDWDDNLRLAMARETELFLESQLRGDRSLKELLTADYTFVNERLASHYGIPGVYGSHFRRVALPANRRAGLLGQASILTVTSFPNRTSPVVRGKWLLENMLGAPPPAPPPDVPDLPENEKGAEPKTVRQRMEQHRRNPVCASCHAVMDPLGLALEKFDAIGRWRELEDGAPIDSTGALSDGSAIDGPAGLRDLLLSRHEEFVRTVTEKLLTYAVGRGVEYYDMPTVRAIVRDARPGDYRWSSIILGITKSQPFQMRSRRAES